ncbi:uncharacterized protein LOC129950417 [Eupeodes corollae]|uniref:uncharacterized protein LOC129950417 n=1 Tax=Eupeodes corollae TaxID=290404 RepID=UPI0024935409|nr:uncharacterized protein LOC129950417 [Eupeodes corollae]
MAKQNTAIIFSTLLVAFIQMASSASIDQASATPSPNSGLFAADFIGQITKNKANENVIVSPISIQTALAMTYLGAAGKTAEELQTALRLPSTDKDQVGEYFSQVLNKKSGEASLNIANKIFINSEFSLNPEFNGRSEKYFKTGVESLDFKKSPSESVETINTWVENETNKKITNLMKPGSIDQDTISVIVNAIYFNGKWKEPFSQDLTHKSPFWISKDRSIQVDMMSGSDRRIKYGEFTELNATAVEMPYKDSDLSMMLILPSQKDGLANLEAKLSSIPINDLSSKMTVKKVDLMVPKFKIDFSIALVPILKEMGINSMFEKADLPGIFGESVPNVKISDVQQKAYIDVNEAGSEAAAATFLQISLMSLDYNLKFFKVDRPFFFAIKDDNTVYFAGHIINELISKISGETHMITGTNYLFVLPSTTHLYPSNNFWPRSTTLDSRKNDTFPSILFNSVSNQDENKNIIMSPFSIQSALTLLYMGAEGDTAKEFENVLHYNSSNKIETAARYSKILKSISSANNGTMQIQSANRIYTRFELVPKFNEIAEAYFQAEAEMVDFKLREETAKKINTFVEENTNNKIKNLISPNSIDDTTTAMLVNAIYFKAQWANQFSMRATKKRPFYMSDNKTVDVDTMFGEISCKYVPLPDLDATAIQLRYEKTNIVMDVILPNKHDGLRDLEHRLSVMDLGKMFENIIEQDVNVRLPKFRIEFETNLIPVLKEMGMNKTFEYGANFKGIFDTVRPAKISEVIHKAFIDVNENGSEAAASTYTKLVYLSAGSVPEDTFTADHPFMFVIRNPETIFFIGHVKAF